MGATASKSNSASGNAAAGGSNVLRGGAEWVSDQDARKCYRCGANFSVTLRRHHCRMCGGVYCVACCPRSDDVPPQVVRKNPSMPPAQRALERLCLSCRLPAWMLPLAHDAVVPKEQWSDPPPIALTNTPQRHHASIWRVWFADNLRSRVDGVVMQTVLAFCDVADRTRIMQTHPAIRHCLPMPPLRVPNRQPGAAPETFTIHDMPMVTSVAFVFPGVIATGDGNYSGNFRHGTQSLFGSPVGAPGRSNNLDSTQAVAHIGTGGGGAVYYALDRKQGCFVCVKLIAKDFAGQSKYHYDRTFATIEKEIVIQSQLTHASVAPLSAVFQTRGHVVMVSQAGEGRTARSAAIEVRSWDSNNAAGIKAGMLPRIVPFTLKVIFGVITALDYMASRGYVHRDMKLDNVVLTRNYRQVKVIDFGLTDPFSESYAPCGTPSYLSPENVRAVVYQKRRFSADRRTIMAADVFSVGVMAYMMLSNQRPYGPAKDYRRMLDIAEAGIRCSGPGWESVPLEIARFVETMLAYRADQRPTFDDILGHVIFQKYANEIEDVIRLRTQRMEEADLELHNRWDLLLDADDNSDDDTSPLSAPYSPAPPAISAGGTPPNAASPAAPREPQPQKSTAAAPSGSRRQHRTTPRADVVICAPDQDDFHTPRAREAAEALLRGDKDRQRADATTRFDDTVRDMLRGQQQQQQQPRAGMDQRS